MTTRKIALTVTFAFVTFLYLWKLDFPYFFTDEILYINAGTEHLEGIYKETMQVPLTTKYLAAIFYKLFDHNVYLLRLPFALIGILTAFVLYKIIEREQGFLWGIIGVSLFASSSIIYAATRMVMLEPHMHLFWLLFLYYFYNTLNESEPKWFYLSGIFLGLALTVKITSILLFVFTLFFLPKLLKSLKNFLFMYGIGAALFFLSYIHAFFTTGEKATVLAIYNSLIDVYFTKSREGKAHIINGTVYEKSPYWTYAYYLYIKEGILRIIAYIIGGISALFKKNTYVFYWGTFFLLTFIFHQFSGVKNMRYISSFEIPLIILVVSGFELISKRFPKMKSLIILTVVTLFMTHSIQVFQQPRTEYNALFEEYLKPETNNFSSDEKIYIYGSVRSAKWYKHGISDGRQIFETSRSLATYCPDFYLYNYLILEKNEVLRYDKNLIQDHVEANKEYYETFEKYGFIINKKIANPLIMTSVCKK